MTADDVLKALTSGGSVPTWCKRAALITNPGNFGEFATTATNFFPEVTVRIPREGQTRRGKPRFQRRRMDLVALIQPHFKQWTPVVAGVEIKVDLYDLRNDDKMGQYMDYCHLFYLAVPKSLRDEAWGILEGNMGLALAGLLVIDGEQVIDEKKPKILLPSDKNIKEVYAELLIRPFKLGKKELKNFYQFCPVASDRRPPYANKKR